MLIKADRVEITRHILTVCRDHGLMPHFPSDSYHHVKQGYHLLIQFTVDSIAVQSGSPGPTTVFSFFKPGSDNFSLRAHDSIWI